MKEFRMQPQPIVFEHATVLDVVTGQRVPGQRVVVEGGRIARVEPVQAPAPPAAQVIDCAGRTLMPGLCDGHVHVIAWTANLSELMRTSAAYTAARAAEIMQAMLLRGFTTVRDAGGADYGLARAVEEGIIAGPRLLFCGHGLSPTGGHADLRGRGEDVVEGPTMGMGRLCDGVAEVQRACRDEIRKGAHHIKLMLNGGIASPTDRIDNLQFSDAEVRAAVEEAEMAGLYVMAHTYTAKAVNRAIRLGVRSLEHCNLIDHESVELFLRHEAVMVPTLVTYEALAREGVAAGLPADLLGKLDRVREAGLRALQLAHEAGVPLIYGTDLLGAMHDAQLEEFAIRREVQPPIDVVRAATCNAAALFGETGETGVVAPGARADLLLVNGDPLENLGCLRDPERCLDLVMKGGVIFKGQQYVTVT
jgi:imidazolonepropionase-like amidohydrolase